MDIKECIVSRRSVRDYKDQLINKEEINEIVELSKMSPSWKNSQTVRYIVVQDKLVIKEICDKGLLGFEKNANTISKCSALVVIAQVNKRCGYERDGSFTTSKGSGWEMFDAGIATSTFCLAAHDKGYGTCIMGIFDDGKIAQIIELPEGQTVAALVTLGVPEETPEAPPRKANEDILRFI